MAERNLRTGQVDPGQRNPIYMAVCVLFQALRELFTETYSFWSTVKILAYLGAVFIVAVLASAAVEMVVALLLGRGT